MKVGRHGIVGLLLVLGLGVPAASGYDAPPPRRGHDRVDEIMGRYNLHPSFGKLGRGVSNTFTGWMEIPLNIEQRYSTSDTGASFFTGLAYGFFKGLVRTGVGLYETVTFLLPYPEDFAPILPTLEYFKKQGRRQRLLLE